MRGTFCLFDSGAGHYLGRTITCDEGDLPGCVPAGAVAFRDIDRPDLKRVVDGLLVDYQPPAPDADHEWNAVRGCWQLKAPVAARLAAKREAQNQIDALERQQQRAIREHAIGRGGTPSELRKRLEDIDDQIIALRDVINN